MYTIVHTQNLSGTVAPVVATAETYENAKMQMHQMLASDYASAAVTSSYVTILGEAGNALCVETCR